MVGEHDHADDGPLSAVSGDGSGKPDPPELRFATACFLPFKQMDYSAEQRRLRGG